MNREIKFRGKSVETGEWVYGFLIEDSETGHCEIISYADFEGNTFSWDEVDPETVGQYIGRKDKNEVKIHRGDIVRFDDGGIDHGGEGYEFRNEGVVEYDEENALYYLTNREGVDMEDLWCQDSLEVTGNIYKDRDILAGKKNEDIPDKV